MRVVAIHFLPPNQPPNACQIYRINIPLYHMADHGGHGFESISYHALVENIQKNGSKDFIRKILDTDVFVFPRAYAADERMLATFRDIFKLIRMAGKRIVYEVDDDYTNRHRNFEGWQIRNAMKIASWTDAITVTTPHLARLMKKETGLPVYVLPNCLDPEVWLAPERSTKKAELVIGLSGSATHEGDWRVLADVMPRILANDYGFPVRFQITGFHPDYLRELPATEYIHSLQYVEYAESVRNCDIVLAPVDPDDQFNHSKSPLKALEGMAASRYIDGAVGGAATISTDMPAYWPAVKHLKNGLLVQHNPDSWYNGIDQLLRNEALRKQIQLNAHAWVWKNHDIKHTWRFWETAYRQVLSRPPHISE